MKNQSMAKLTKAAGDSRVAMKMKAESAMKLKEKSPMEKELVGKQGNLPPELKAKIEAAPSKMKSAMKKNGDEAKIKALQARLAKAKKEGNDREINAIRLELQQLYKVEKKAKDNSPAKMKEKSAMKKDLPEATVTAKKDKTISFKKSLKKGYSKDAEGNVLYRGKPVPSYRLKDAYEVTSSTGGVVSKIDKRTKMDKEYKVVDKKGGSAVPMKRKTQVDGEQVTASKASGGMFMKKPMKMKKAAMKMGHKKK